MVQLTDTEYCTCALLFLNKHPEYQQLWCLTECMEPEAIGAYYGIENVQEKTDAMENDFVNFVKAIDVSQQPWNIAWKLAEAKVYALKICHNNNNQWIAESLDIPLDVVRALRVVLDYDDIMT